MSLRAFLDHPLPIAFAHRGGSEEAPENSVAAFAAALRQGFTHLETDVHLTSDGTLVAFHDERLDRVTDGTGAIADLPWSEVSRARIGGSEPIPTMDELFETFPDAFFNIDAKADQAVVALASAVRRHRAEDRVCIGAFSDDRLQRIRSLFAGAICTTAGPRETAALVAAARVGARRSGRACAYDCLQVPVRHKGVEIVNRRFVDAAHARDVQVHVWTIDDPAEMHRLLDLGVDGIMTDRPSVLRAVIDERRVSA